jgi:AraC-like DNA-binding protein
VRAQFERIPPAAERFFLVKRRHDPRFEFRWHYHAEYELTLIVNSRGRRFVGDHIEDYDEGDLVLLGPDLPHTWCSAPTRTPMRHDAVVVQFTTAMLGPDALTTGRLGSARTMLERAARGLRFSGPVREEIGARMLTLERLSPLRQLGELLIILDRLSESANATTVLSSRTLMPQPHAGHTHPIDRVCAFLNQRYLERIPLAQAARVLAMSPSAFSRYFRRTTGKTFTRYLNELRVGHACGLLMDSERGIADIASEAGFTNLSHFNRIFLRLRRMRPSEYRNEVRRYRALGDADAVSALP